MAQCISIIPLLNVGWLKVEAAPPAEWCGAFEGKTLDRFCNIGAEKLLTLEPDSIPIRFPSRRHERHSQLFKNTRRQNNSHGGQLASRNVVQRSTPRPRWRWWFWWR